MIISKTPLRISFFGGGSDYPIWYKNYDGEVISTTINKNIYISYKILQDFYKHKFRIIYSKIENVKKITEISHSVVRSALAHYKINNGAEIHYNSDLPSRAEWAQVHHLLLVF